jgi:transcriptional regulator with XRE-family HTH domain
MDDSGLVEQLKKAIRESGLSLAEIARLSKVDHTRLSRFVRDDRTLTLPAAQQVCDALGLRIQLVKGSPSDANESQPADGSEAPQPARRGAQVDEPTPSPPRTPRRRRKGAL